MHLAVVAIASQQSGSSLGRSSRLVVRSASRWFHSSVPVNANASNKANNASRDVRLAGRRRFYKHVGIIPVSPPWEQLSSTIATVESPVSAGVDGTQSASGVGTTLPTPELLSSLLMPRRPGSADPVPSSQWFGVTLDGKAIRTPLGQPLAVPSQYLAWAIAAEWDAQHNTLTPAQMPLMTLACTTLDQTAAHPHVIRQHALRYLPTDTTCYWADPSEDRSLHRRQQQAWEKLHDYCFHTFGSRPASAIGASEGLLMSRARLESQKSSGLPHPTELLQAAKDWVHTLDAWHLTALHSVTADAKSFLVGMAVVTAPCNTNSPCHDVSKAITAARVEEEFQIENWGLVEGGHDYDRLNSSVQMRSAQLLTFSIATENFV